MKNCYKEFRKKELVSITEGIKIGYVDDFNIDVKTAQITHLVIGGRGKFFGLFFKEADIMIPWDNIRVIGVDAILVDVEDIPVKKTSKKASGFLKNILA